MNDKDKEYNEFLEICNKGNGNNPTQRQSAQQTRTTARPGRYLAPKRMSAKKRKARQRKIAVVSVLALAVLVLIAVLSLMHFTTAFRYIIAYFSRKINRALW